jgi:hypothetical protein
VRLQEVPPKLRLRAQASAHLSPSQPFQHGPLRSSTALPSPARHPVAPSTACAFQHTAVPAATSTTIAASATATTQLQPTPTEPPTPCTYLSTVLVRPRRFVSVQRCKSCESSC